MKFYPPCLLHLYHSKREKQKLKKEKEKQRKEWGFSFIPISIMGDFFFAKRHLEKRERDILG